MRHVQATIWKLSHKIEKGLMVFPTHGFTVRIFASETLVIIG